MKTIGSDTIKTFPVSVRLPEVLNDQIETIAKINDRPKSWVIEQAITDYVAVQQWQIKAIEEGIRAADAGQLIDHAEVEAWVKSWDTPNERPKPTCKK